LKKFIFLGLVLYSISSSLGLFLSRTPSASYDVLACGIRSARLVFLPHSVPLTSSNLPYIILGIILLNFVVQVTGGIHSSLWPAASCSVLIAAFSRYRYETCRRPHPCRTTGTLSRRTGQAFRWEVYAGYACPLRRLARDGAYHEPRRAKNNRSGRPRQLLAHASAVVLCR
jgi:hypothetical protein